MNHIVVGAGFGDEGKGQTVSDLLKCTKDIDLVVRFNGGHQAGHTVEFNGIRHVFSNFGAGSLQHVPTYWSRFCTINPVAIRNEYNVLKKKGCTPVLYIDPYCPVTTPWDICANIDNNTLTGHGTVGVGFGATIARQEAFFKLFAEDLKTSSIMLPKLQAISEYYSQGVSNDTVAEWFNAIDWLITHNTIKITLPPKPLRQVIFEGAQGILLDQDLGFFPHVTRSKTTAHNAFQLIHELGLPASAIVHHVSRVYHTRHGNGPFLEAGNEKFLKDDILETNKYNDYQGEFKIAPLNLDWLNYAIRMAKFEHRGFQPTYVTRFTCADHLLDTSCIPVILNDELKHISLYDLQRGNYEISENI